MSTTTTRGGIKDMVKRHALLQAGNLILGLATIAVNILAGLSLINNTSTAAISDQYNNLFTPSGITFAIWGVIYALIIVFLVYQLKGLRKGDVPDAVGKIGGYFMLSCVANIAWIFIWQYKYINWTLLPMVILLLSLIEIYTRLGIGKTTPARREWVGARLLFSVYLGWITVATIANVTAYLVAIGWDGFGISEATWFGTILAVATIVALLVIWIRRDLAYTLVFVWAYIGIIIKRLQPGPPKYGIQPDLAAYTVVMIVIIVFAYLIRIIADRPSKKKGEEKPAAPTTEESPLSPTPPNPP